jgi:hypothetical protein
MTIVFALTLHAPAQARWWPIKPYPEPYIPPDLSARVHQPSSDPMPFPIREWVAMIAALREAGPSARGKALGARQGPRRARGWFSKWKLSGFEDCAGA